MYASDQRAMIYELVLGLESVNASAAARVAMHRSAFSNREPVEWCRGTASNYAMQSNAFEYTFL